MTAFRFPEGLFLAEQLILVFGADFSVLLQLVLERPLLGFRRLDAFRVVSFLVGLLDTRLCAGRKLVRTFCRRRCAACSSASATTALRSDQNRWQAGYDCSGLCGQIGHSRSRAAFDQNRPRTRNDGVTTSWRRRADANAHVANTCLRQLAGKHGIGAFPYDWRGNAHAHGAGVQVGETSGRKTHK